MSTTPSTDGWKECAWHAALRHDGSLRMTCIVPSSRPPPATSNTRILSLSLTVCRGLSVAWQEMQPSALLSAIVPISGTNVESITAPFLS